MDGETLGAYLKRMTPTAVWASRRWAGRHAYLGEDDLLQEAMLALVGVWRRLYGQKGFDDLRRIGRTAVLRRLWGQHARASARGEGRVAVWVGLDDPLYANGGDGRATVAEVIAAEGGDEDAFLPFVLEALSGVLDGAARAALAQTVAGGRAADEGALLRGKARVLGVVKFNVPPSVYREIEGQQPMGAVADNQRKGDEKMPSEKTLIPDDLELGLPEAEKPVVKQAAAKKKSGVKTAKPKAEKSVSKPKAEKLVPKPKAPRTAKANGKGRKLADELNVVVGEAARKGSFREKIQTFTSKAIAVGDLLEKVKAVPNARAKISNMLRAGLLKVA